MDSAARYLQIADGLRTQINTGDLKPGDPVPAEAEIARREGVARMTARAALLVVEREGLITGGRPKRVARHERITVHLTRPGPGWAGESPTAGADAWGAAVRAAGRKPSQRIKVDPNAPASSDAAERLGVAPGQPVVVRRLVRYANDEPSNMITFWFLHEVAAGTPIAEPESVAEGTIAWLERQMELEHLPPEWHPRMPSPDEAEILRIPPGVPVEEVWRTSTAGGRPAAVSRAIYPGDRIKLTG